MPNLVKLYIRHSLIGFAIAAVFVAMLLWFNVMNLWTMISNDQSAVLAVFILWFFNGVVFAGVQFAWAVMSLAEPKQRPGGGLRQHAMVPQPVRAEARKPR